MNQDPNGMPPNPGVPPGYFPGPGDTQFPGMGTTLYPGVTLTGFNPNAASAQNFNTPSVTGLLQALRRRWLMAFSLATVAAIGVLIATFILMPLKYAAETRLHVAATPMGPIVAPTDQGKTNGEFPVYKATVERLVKTPVLISNALQEKVSHGRTAGELPMVRKLGADAVSFLEGRLKTDFFLGPETLRISLQGENAEDVAEILNAVATVLLREITSQEMSIVKARIDQYERKAVDLETEITSLYRQREQLRGSSKTPSRGDTVSYEAMALRQKLIDAEREERDHKKKFDEKQDELDGYAEKLLRLDTVTLSKEERRKALEDDAEIKEYKKHILQLEAEIDEIGGIASPGLAPALTAAKRRELDVWAQKYFTRRDTILAAVIAEVRDSSRKDLQEKINIGERRVSRLKLELADATRHKNSLKSQIDQLDFSRPGENVDVTSTSSRIETLEKTRTDLIRAAAGLKAEKWLTRVTLQQPATAPNALDYSRQLKLGGSGAIAVFGLVLFAISLAEFFARRVSHADEISRGVGLPLLGSVPRAPSNLRKNSDQPPTESELIWESQVNESVDGVRTILLHANRRESLRVVMVTSANSGEGKTTLASQIASSLSRAWKRVLLIDGDMRNPGCHKLFNVPHEPGFSEVLRGEAKANDVVRGTPISRLWVLPAGNWDQHAVQSLSQESLAKILEELKDSYDFIVVDSCPVLPVNDTLLLAQHVDGVIFSVLRDVTRAPEVQNAVRRLTPLNVRMLGAVMLGVRPDSASSVYQYVGAAKQVGSSSM